jgi:glycosyltransferase involved in cell wall biosynthesis
VPYVFNVSDLWPESAIRLGVVRPGIATRAAEWLEQSLYRRALAITGQSDEILVSVTGKAPSVPTHLVTNGVDPGRFGPEQADEEARALIGSAPGPIFIFAGLLGLAQGLDQLLDLARDLPAEVPGRIVLVGDGPVRDHLAERIRLEGLEPRVLLLPQQPRDRVPALLASADVAIISLGLSIAGAVPSKIYEAMASARPILLAADGEAARRVDAADAGLSVAPGEPEALRAAFRRLATDARLRARLGAAGRRAAESTYDRDAIAALLDRFLRTLLDGVRR